jgi:hypothetical protein
MHGQKNIKCITVTLLLKISNNKTKLTPAFTVNSTLGHAHAQDLYSL